MQISPAHLWTRFAACTLSLLLLRGVAAAGGADAPAGREVGAPGRESHDLPLPSWGPYSKRYPGVSHIPDLASGMRFDLSVFPGFFRGPLTIPSVCWESGYAPWRAAPDGTAWEFRYDLRGQDELAVTVRYVVLDETRVRVRIVCTNHTAVPESLSLDLIAGIQYPFMSARDSRPAVLPVDVTADRWLDARDYLRRSVVEQDPLDRLQPDGRLWHELRETGLVQGGGVWLAAGQSATWQVPTGASGTRWARVRAADRDLVLDCDGHHIPVARGGWRTLALPDHGPAFTVRCLGPGRLDLNGFAFGAEPAFKERALNPVPTISYPDEQTKAWLRRDAYSTQPREHAAPDAITLTYPDLHDASYSISWDNPRARLRDWKMESLDPMMKQRRNDHVSTRFTGEGTGDWTDIVIEPVLVPAKGEKVVEVVVATGGATPALTSADDDGERRLWTNPDLGQQVMAATMLTNVVYPIYTRRQYVRHYTPGKIWDSLYTWDCGFIGLGLLELNPARGAAVLRQYLMPENDPDCAYLEHGSPVPVQIFLAQAWWNRTHSINELRTLFPSLRQMHRYLVGRYGGSDTARLRSGLLQTWSIFYNSGGWDDYPPQFARPDANTTPVVTSSMLIRTAKILKYFAAELGQDSTEFDADIARLSTAVQKYAWDDAEGWFSYVRHDANGQPTGIFRHPSGANYNRGLDGLTPLIAGICTEEQTRRLLDHLDRALMTPVGVSTVDVHAPYYSVGGYWNGSVWMPHQWFLWRALLDLGETDRAWRIAETALRVWREEVERTHQTREMFSIQSGRAAGWTQFGGLSSPVLMWSAAYSTPGRITGGYNLWIERQEATPNQVRAQLRLTGDASRSSSVLVVLPGTQTTATWNGQPVPSHRRSAAVEVQLPAAGTGELVVTAEP